MDMNMESDTCRVCWTKFKLKDLKFIFDETTNLAQIINETLPIEVLQDDEFKYICSTCHNKVTSHYEFIQSISTHARKKEIVPSFEVNRNEKLENVIISKLHSDMICICPNCKKDLILLLKKNPEDSNYAFEITLAVVDHIQKSEEIEQSPENVTENVTVDVSTQKSNTMDKEYKFILNSDTVKNMTNVDNQDANSIHIDSPKNIDYTKSCITWQKSDASEHKLIRGTKRKFQERVPTEAPAKSFKVQKLIRLNKEEQKSEKLDDYDKLNLSSFITFHVKNEDVDDYKEVEIEEEDNTESMMEKLDNNLTELQESEKKLNTEEQDNSNSEYDRLNTIELTTFQTENNEVEYIVSNVDIIENNDSTDAIEMIEDDSSNNKNLKSNVKLVCVLCGARYISQMKYRFHMDRHRFNKMDKCICIICDKETKSENLLWEHYLHMHESPMRYICLICNKTFTTKTNLNVHQKSYGHSGHKKILSVEMDEVLNEPQKVVKRKQKCTVCRKLMKDVDPNSDVKTCASCEDFNAYLIVDGKAKVMSQRQYHCAKCRKHFMRQERLEFHEMRHNENMDEFKCSSCSKEFSGENALYEHYLFVHKGVRPHVCEVCGKSFQLKARLKEHHRTHTGEKPYQCEICGQRCMTTHALKFHKKSHVSTRHMCEICGKSFLKKQNLNEHLEKHWKKDRNISLPQIFTCPMCDTELPTLRMLKHHMIGFHNLDRKDPLITKQIPLYECNDCHEKFKHQMTLKAHKDKVHEGNVKPRVFQCDICKAEYKVKQLLLNHIQSKHSEEKRFKCAQCNKKFADMKSLYDHVLVHTGRKPFTCEYCNLNFRRKIDRDAHRREHTNTRTYRCPDCPKIFTSYISRTRHRKKVHGDNETECSECGKKFGDVEEMKIHLNDHHSENTL
ncbi:hypothetical protein PUN28_005924 [Cardiocondyla obscurior]